MTDIFMVRTSTGLTPADLNEWEALTGDRIKMGATCKCTITVPRNLKFLRKYMAMIGQAFEMQDSFTNIKHWRHAVQVAAGHFDSYIDHNGNINYIAKSVSFANCDETEFRAVYNNAIQAICDHWLKSEPDQYKLILGYM